MKKILALLFVVLIQTINAQTEKEQEVTSTVNEVTVFIKNAQIVRKKSVNLSSGKTILKFSNLSPFIKPQSVKVKAIGDITVLNVSHQQNYLDDLKKSDALISLENQLEEIREKIDVENMHLEILKERLEFLKANRNITGTNEQTSVSNLEQTSNFYNKELTSIKTEQIKRTKNATKLIREKNDLKKQLNNFTGVKEYPTGEVLVKIDAKISAKVNFELTYLVTNASWYPTYDIRAKNINEPIELVYKANVKQDSKVDWTGVKLKFSSAEPSTSGVAPELKPYFLNYNSKPPRYDLSSALKDGMIIGTVFDETGPLPGANVLVKGTTIGTATDFDGKFELAIPKDARELQFTYLGYITKTQFINSNNLNVVLEADEQTLDEVVVLGYGTTSSTLRGRVNGVNVVSKPKKKESSIAIPFETEENQTSLEFEIKTPYSIKSNNKNYVVDMTRYELDSEYQYYSVPKIDTSAFLLAYITDWEQYNLLAGEATIFFEDTFIGKSVLDTRHSKDTLQISLGRDKNVSVTRNKVKDFSSKKFVGTKKEESRDWEIEIRNSKNQSINMVVYDQIPVATIDEIKVEIQNKSSGKLDPKSGKLKWEFDLNTNETKNIELKYFVKYPKNKSLVLD